MKNKSLHNSKLKIKKDNSIGYQQSVKHISGFGLVELTITLTILAVVISIAAPSIIGQLAAMEAKRFRFEATNMLKLAKSESLIRHQNVFVCLTNNSGVCHKDGSQSLLLFLDKNNNNQYNAGVDLLLSESQLGLIYATVHLRASDRDYTRFSADSGKSRGFMGHINYCPSSAFKNNSYQVSFNMSGIIKFKPNSLYPNDCPS